MRVHLVYLFFIICVTVSPCVLSGQIIQEQSELLNLSNVRVDKNNSFKTNFSFDQGNIYKLSAAYDIIDALNVEGGVIIYESENEDSFLYQYREQDRLFAGLKYSF